MRLRGPRTTFAVAATAIGVAVLGGCGGSTHGPAQASGSSEAAIDQGGVQVVTVSAGNDLRFAQTALTAHPGKVKVVLDVTGSVPHNLAFSDGPQGSTGTVTKGQAVTTLVFAKSGTYHFLCTIHPRMQGTLTIE